jgi:hypothetical protein
MMIQMMMNEHISSITGPTDRGSIISDDYVMY